MSTIDPRLCLHRRPWFLPALRGEINHEHDGSAVYLLDPSGHYLELITRTYP